MKRNKFYKKRPFSLFYRSYRLIKNWNSNPKPFIVDADRKLIYLNNPKVACSSIKTSIFGEQNDIHAFADTYRTYELNEEMMSYYKFTFVRNPFKRLVSCFEDKCNGNYVGLTVWDYYKFGQLFSKIHDFNQFVYWVVLIPNRWAEPHFAGQYQMIYTKGKCQVDFVGKIENLKDEYEPIRERFNLLPLEQKNRVFSKTGKNWMDYYTPFTARLVYWKFKKDFEVFGYEEEYTKLMDYLKSKNKV